MRFGEIGVGPGAVGTILAHAVRFEGGTFKKGRRLESADVERLGAAGVTTVVGVTLEAGDVLEDEVASRLGRALAGSGLNVMPAAHGRCDLRAAARGVVVFERDRLDAINAADWRLTVGTVPPFHLAEKGERVATVKVIPFAVDDDTVCRTAGALAEPTPLLRLAPFRTKRVALVLSHWGASGEGHAAALDKIAAVQRTRVESLGSVVALERRCLHAPGAIADALSVSLDADVDLVLFMGASAVSDPEDVFPLALRSVGGVVEHIGMPVEPGNLLVLGRHGARSVLGVPGCARSLRFSGFDGVLQRVVADLPVGPMDIARMGAGGLLSRGVGERVRAQSRYDRSRPAAVVLAAGRSERMGDENKLLVPIDGVPMVRRVVERVADAGLDPIVVVTGHDADNVRAALAGCRVRFAHNADFGAGMGTSLAAGVHALDDDQPVLVALGDMPDVRTEHIAQLLSTFESGDALVVAPSHEGRRGHPVLFAPSLIPSLRACDGDRGARRVVADAGDAVCLVPVDDPAVLLDLDTPAAIAKRQGEIP